MSAAPDVQRAMEAHSNLNTMAAVVALLEGGLLYGGGSVRKTALRIITLSKAEQARQLKIMDKATGRTS
jgi:hypothetical protein